MKDCIISLDQGTSSCRAIAYDQEGNVMGSSQEEFTQIYPQAGWVEHDPKEIWSVQKKVFDDLIEKLHLSAEDVKGIGITNQRETTVVWDKRSGEPIYNAIVWQDKRTSDYCQELKNNHFEAYIRKNTGLVIDAYFSATKVNWILNNVEGANEKALKGDLLFGTIDTWLIWNLTNGKSHATDYSNASRTMLFNIHSLEWDSKLLAEMQIPPSMLPEVKDSSDLFGYYTHHGFSIPICGVAGDQQSALFGQQCFSLGDAKNTYGTGCFMLMNTGEKAIESKNGLLTTIAWGINGKITYALEGSVFVAGAAVQWLRDGLKFFKEASETEELITNATLAEDLVVVPTFAGLGSPYWDMSVKGAIFGLTRDTGINELTKATLESIAFQTMDVLSSMEKDSDIRLNTLQVDGGACANNFLMQFQSDILNARIQRPENIESTAYGSFLLAALYLNFLEVDTKNRIGKIDRVFLPKMSEEQRLLKLSTWKIAIERLRR